jgi:hypothetical protein
MTLWPKTFLLGALRSVQRFQLFSFDGSAIDLQSKFALGDTDVVRVTSAGSSALVRTTTTALKNSTLASVSGVCCNQRRTGR